MTSTADSKIISNTPGQNGGEQFNYFDRISQIGLNTTNPSSTDKRTSLEETLEINYNDQITTPELLGNTSYLDETEQGTKESQQTIDILDNTQVAPVQQNSNNYALSSYSLTIALDAALLTTLQNNSFGHYFSDENGNPISGKVNLSNVDEDLKGSKNLTIQYESTEVPAEAVHVGFFLIPNDNSLNSLITNGTNVTFQETGSGWSPFVNNSSIQGDSSTLFYYNQNLRIDNIDYYISNSTDEQVDLEQILGSDGNHIIEGGAGDDLIKGDSGNDTLLGGDGNDTIHGGKGDDLIKGGAGDDLIKGGSGNDTLLGGDGNDTINGGDGDDWIEGGDGDDWIEGGSGNDTIQGNEGNDNIIAGDGDDLVLGGSGNDSIDGGDGADTIQGNSGDDSIAGGADQDILIGGDGDDTVHGGEGNDFVAGNDGDDTLSGGDGDDYVVGGSGNDSIDGNDGDDHLYGGDGADTINGGDGNDLIAGGRGDDVLIGDSIPNTDPTLLDNGNYDISSGGGFTISIDSISSNAGYNTSLGYYFADENGEPISGVVSFANVKDSLGEGDAATMSYAEGDIPAGAEQIGFFIIPNGANKNSELADGDEVTFAQNEEGEWTPILDGNELEGAQGVAAFFSNEALNSDGFDHMSDDNGVNQLQISFEDLVGGGDSSFDDVVATTTITGEEVVGQNDTLIGGEGDDTIDGGAGDDIAIYSGAYEDYNITANDDGSFTIEDTTAERDGTDVVANVETFQFSDGNILTEDLMLDNDTALNDEILADDTDNWTDAISNDSNFNDTAPSNWMEDIEIESHDNLNPNNELEDDLYNNDDSTPYTEQIDTNDGEPF